MEKLKISCKDKVGTLKTRSSKITPEKLVKGSLKRVHSNKVELFFVKQILIDIDAHIKPNLI